MACRVVEGVGFVAADEDLDEVVLEFEPELGSCGAISTAGIQRVGGIFMGFPVRAEETVSILRGLDDAFRGVWRLLLDRHLFS